MCGDVGCTLWDALGLHHNIHVMMCRHTLQDLCGGVGLHYTVSMCGDVGLHYMVPDINWHVHKMGAPVSRSTPDP